MLVEPVAQALHERAVETGQAELQTVQAATSAVPDMENAARLVNQEAIDYAHNRAAEMVGRKFVDVWAAYRQLQTYK